MAKPLRRAGAVWRLLVHRHPTDGPKSDMAYHVQSDRVGARTDSEWSQTIVLDRTEFDELAVGNGLIHVEQLDTGLWWMAVGGVVLFVETDCDGRAKQVTVYGPGDYDDALPGAKYHLNWTADEN